MSKKKKKEKPFTGAYLELLKYLKRFKPLVDEYEKRFGEEPGEYDEHHIRYFVRSHYMLAIAGSEEVRVIRTTTDQVLAAWSVYLDELGWGPKDLMSLEQLCHMVQDTKLPFPNVVLEFEDVPNFYFLHQSEEIQMAVAMIHDRVIGHVVPEKMIGMFDGQIYADSMSGLESENVEGANSQLGTGAVVLVGMARILEAANVDLVPAKRQAPQGHVEHRDRVMRYEIAVKQSARRANSGDPQYEVNYNHRFERRGNFAHHYELTAEGKPNRIYAKWSVERPEKVVIFNGEPCVKIWRPPTVVGPSDKPFIPKVRNIK